MVTTACTKYPLHALDPRLKKENPKVMLLFLLPNIAWLLLLRGSNTLDVFEGALERLLEAPLR